MKPNRWYLAVTLLAAASMLLAACAPAAAPSPTPTKAPAATPAAGAGAAAPASSNAERTAKLYEDAKKEGQVMAYLVGSQTDWEAFAAAFEKKYPGIKTNGFTGTSESIRDKVLTEARAGRQVADLIAATTFEDFLPLQQAGVLDKYLSPETAAFDKLLYDPEGYWVLPFSYKMLIDYNTQAVPKAQAPKSYQDLLKPEFKGKLGLEANAVPWFTVMLQIMGREKGLDYMRKLADQKPRLVSGHTVLHKLVVSGEIPISVYNFSRAILEDKLKGAPVDWVGPEEGTPATLQPALMIKNAPHPNAARLLMDFLLSAEGGKIRAEQYYIPFRIGVDMLPEVAAQSKVKGPIITDPNIGKETADNEKIFREIFGSLQPTKPSK